MKLLWLVYERPPHPDAVVHPIETADADFVLALLEHPYERRIDLTRQLSNYLKAQEAAPPTNRPPVPCRMPSGLYRLVPWRLAKWLRHVLPAPESVIRRTASRIERWRSASSSAATVRAESSRRNRSPSH